MASKKKLSVDLDVEDKFIEANLSESLVTSFNKYAKAVIYDRAIPDVRDGLKPVQRRIVYCMYNFNYTWNHETKKNANIVGDVMGKFHPHGDASIYDALVRLSQNWKMNIPLVEFQGNNGDIDNDPAAASRYTEGRLDKSSMYMVNDIDDDTVDMVYTYDDSRMEPTVLPSLLPNLLVNGSSGIAIGCSTNIPSHNINEICEAIIYRIEHKRATVDDLLQFVKGPDFPTGGIIDDKEAIENLYRTGQASFYVHSKVEIDEEANQLIITEIPFNSIKRNFVHDLDEKRIKDRIDNIEEIRDESTTDVRIVLDIKKGASPKAVLNYLNSKGLLRNTFSANMFALNKNHPKTMNLIEIIDAYIEHQQDILTRKYKFNINKNNRRLEIISGLVRAVSEDMLDAIIALIRKCNGKADVIQKLQEVFNFTPLQAEAIAMMPLYRISNLEIRTLKEEHEQLTKEVAEMEDLLKNIDKLNKVIIKNIKEMAKVLAKERRTVIRDEKFRIEQIDATKLISKEDCMVVLTRDGYIKRTSLVSYQKSLGENSVDNLPKIKLGDQIKLLLKTDTHNNILAFTNLGNFFYIPIHMIPDIKWKEEGRHINSLITCDPKEKVVKAYVMSEFTKGLYVVSMTANNKIKRTEIGEFAQNKITTKPLKCCSLISDDDRVVKSIITTGNSDVVVVNERGVGSRFNENDIPLSGMRTAGVKAMDLKGKVVPLVDLFAIPSYQKDNFILLVTDERCGRLFKNITINKNKRCGAASNYVQIGESNKMKVVGTDLIQSPISDKEAFCATISGNVKIELNKFTPSEISCIMKENIGDKTSNFKIIGLHDFSFNIDDILKPELAPLQKVEQPKTQKEVAQLDLFGDIDAIINKGNKK